MSASFNFDHQGRAVPSTARHSERGQKARSYIKLNLPVLCHYLLQCATARKDYYKSHGPYVPSCKDEIDKLVEEIEKPYEWRELQRLLVDDPRQVKPTNFKAAAITMIQHEAMVALAAIVKEAAYD